MYSVGILKLHRYGSASIGQRHFTHNLRQLPDFFHRDVTALFASV
jgi:hypothetical protein